MEKIKKLLKEYEIRFKETDEILESSSLIEDVNVNSGRYIPMIKDNVAYNKNGCVYHMGEWAIAKLTKKPEMWVVEVNKTHPMWKKFEEWWNKEYNSCMFFHDDRVKYVLSNETGVSQLINAIDRQLLTLDQWAKLFVLEYEKEGKFGKFWDNYREGYKISYMTGKHDKLYSDADFDLWHNFRPFSPELQEMIKKEFDEIN